MLLLVAWILFLDERTHSNSNEVVRTSTESVTPVRPAAPADINRTGQQSESTDCPPIPQIELRILSSAGYSTEALEPYSVLDRMTVAEMARQGDTLAMLALAELEVYAARGFGDEANWTARQNMSSGSPTKLLAENQQAEKWQAALDWYYRAALEGRVLALIQYGRILTESEATPVELGWILAADYEVMSDLEERALTPAAIYQEAAKRLAPESYDREMRSVDAIVPEHDFSDTHELVIDSVIEQFFRDLDGAGLSTPEAVVSDFPVYSSNLASSCFTGGP